MSDTILKHDITGMLPTNAFFRRPRWIAGEKMTGEDFKAARKVVGIKQSCKAVEKGTAQKVFIAADADERVLKPLLELCEEKAVMLVTVDSLQELGRLCGIQVGAAAVAWLKE